MRNAPSPPDTHAASACRYWREDNVCIVKKFLVNGEGTVGSTLEGASITQTIKRL